MHNQIEIVQVLGTILPIDSFFDEESSEPTALAREFGVPVDAYADEDQHRVLHALEHETIPITCWHINWNGKDIIVVGRYIGTIQEIGFRSNLKIDAHELSTLSEEIQIDLDRLSVEQKVGVFLYTTHQFVP